MTAATLISDLTARGVEFQVSGDTLRFRPADRLTPAEVEVIRSHKSVILKLLRSEVREAPAPWPIVEGSEHFSLWINDPAGPLPEFVPGHHYDVRQPSRLRGLCSPCDRTDDYSYRWPDGDVQRDEARALETLEVERQRIIDGGEQATPF
jgi:hypothetical protein